MRFKLALTALAVAATFPVWAQEITISVGSINSEYKDATADYKTEGNLTVKNGGSIVGQSLNAGKMLHINKGGCIATQTLTVNGLALNDKAPGDKDSRDPVGGGSLQANTVTVKVAADNNNSFIVGDTASFKADTLIFENKNVTATNAGVMEVGSIEGTSLNIKNVIKNDARPKLTVGTVGQGVIQNLTNQGDFYVGDKGSVLTVSVNLINEENAKLLASDGVSNIGLDVKGNFTNSAKGLTLTELKNEGTSHFNADTIVLGDADLKTVNIASGASLSAANLTLYHLNKIEGNLAVEGDATVQLGTANEGSSFKVGKTLTVLNQLNLQSSAEDTQLNDVVLKGQGQTGYLAFRGSGDYSVNTITVQNNYGEGHRYNGIQVFNSNVEVGQMIIEDNANGMVNFYENTSDNTITANIANLSVGVGSTLLLNAEAVKDSSNPSNSILTVQEATFADNSSIVKKDDDTQAVHTSFESMTTTGNVTIEKLPGNSSVEVANLTLNDGDFVSNQALTGEAMTVTVNEGTSATFNETVDVNRLDVNLNTLAENSLTVAAMSESTAMNVVLDPALNNKPAAEVVAAINSSIDAGDHDYSYVIPESELYGEVNGLSNGAYTQVENTKLSGLSATNAITTTVWRHEMNDLTKRMGELRDSPEGIGAWVRLYGSEQEYNNTKQRSTSVQVGADYRINQWVVGGAFSYTDGSSDYVNGSGDTDSYSVAAYGSWLAENGMFLDLIAKYSRLENDFEISDMVGELDNNAYSLSAEIGWRFDFNEIVYVEPQAELTYGRIFGDTATTANGVKIDQDDTDFLIGRVGLRAGLKFPDNKGSVYARISGAHDFKGETAALYTTSSASRKMEDDLGGSWVEYAVGANFNLTDHTYTYVDLERTDGGEVRENWRWNVGIRHVF